MARKKLLYFYTITSTFVRRDIAFLSKHYDVVTQDYLPRTKWATVGLLFRQAWLLFRHLWGAKAVFVMFGGYHAFLPALLGKCFRVKVYIILGGADSTSYPSIDYGIFRKPMQGKITCAAYRLSARLLPVHEALMWRENHYYEKDSPIQGVRHWCPGFKTPHTTIHNGYDPDQWDPGDSPIRKENTFVTIATLSDPGKITLKGIDLIVEAAKALPEATFTIIGFQGHENLLPTLPNLVLIPFLASEEFKHILQTTQFYLQLSITEGFPNAISEAMLIGCIPIGSAVSAIPHIIGDTGLILERRDPNLLIDLLKTAMALPDKDDRSRRARMRISTHFHLKTREEAFLRLIAHGA